MASYNTAQIIDVGKKYGVNLDDMSAQPVMNATRGGDPAAVEAYFQNKSNQTSSTGVDPVISNAQKLLDFQKKANEPIVAAKQGEKAPLEQRYQDLLTKIGVNKTADVANQTRITNNEFGKRGIVGSSTMAQQGLQDATTPINQQYLGLEKDALNSQNTDLADLATQIASLQAGNPLEATSGALNIYGVDQQAKNLAAQIAASQYQSPEDQALKQAQASYYSAAASGKLPNTSSSLDSLWSQFGGK